MCGVCDEGEDDDSDVESPPEPQQCQPLDDEAHELLSQWAHKTVVQVKGKKRPQSARAVSIESMEQLHRLLTSGTKISKIVHATRKSKGSHKLPPNVDLKDDEVLVLVDSGSRSTPPTLLVTSRPSLT